MSERILVAGANGFVGAHLVRELYQSGYEVVGLGRQPEPSPAVSDQLHRYIQCDLTDKDAVSALNIEGIDGVINLAGIASVGSSFGQEDFYNKVNVESQTNLLDLIKLKDKKIRIICVSSGATYDPSQTVPLSESSRQVTVSNSSPYAFSKVLMEEHLQHYITAGMDIIIARPFNHTGPGQTKGFIVPDLISQALSEDKILIGPKNTQRDYTDVRDVVKAYRLLLKNGSSGVYNICSGTPTSRDELLQLILEGTQTNPTITVDPSLGRANDPEIIYGDHQKLTDDTGWQTTIPLRQTIIDTISSMKESET